MSDTNTSPTKPDNELFELCKQVKDATGWKDTGKVWYSNAGGVHDIDSVWVDGEVFDKPANVPLYTSDYLLEKLPDTYEHLELSVWKSGSHTWRAGYEMPYSYSANTPLKALLKLTLELHQNGAL